MTRDKQYPNIILIMSEEIDNPSLNNFKNLVLSGGGLLGISYIGLLKYLEEYNLMSQIKTITGSSAGAIFGTFFAIGYTSSELESQVKGIIFKDYVKINAESLLNFPRNKGFESGNLLMKYIKDLIANKTNNPDITFSQLYQKYQINLQIGTTNLTHYRFEIFNHINTPDISVSQAIRASIAIPFVFEPIIINGNLYCDGGLIENLPIEYIQTGGKSNTNNPDIIQSDKLDQPDKPDKPDQPDQPDQPTLETLGVYLLNNTMPLDESNYQTATISHYFSSIMRVLSITYYNRKKVKELEGKNQNKIILIEIPCDIMTFLKINASRNDLENIINIAYETCKKEFNHRSSDI